MATVTTKRCDVFKTIGDEVESFAVRILRIRKPDGVTDRVEYKAGTILVETVVFEKTPDLCPKALKQLERRITTATKPPSPRAVTADSKESTDAG